MEIIADVIEILAVFLLAVEAIKTENLRKFQRKYLHRIYLAANPSITIVDTAEEAKQNFSVTLYLVIVWLMGFLVVLPLYLIFCPSIGYPFLRWAVALIVLLLFPILLVWPFFIFCIRLLIAFLRWIQRNTFTGVVGILGFFLYLAQFCLRRFLIEG